MGSYYWKLRDLIYKLLERTKKPKLPLETLIELSVSRCLYSIIDCPLCYVKGRYTEMVFRRSNIVDIPDVPVRDDVMFKCPVCAHTLHIGNPMTREDAKEEIRLRGNSRLMSPTYRNDERDDEAIIERLRALGYGF